MDTINDIHDDERTPLLEQQRLKQTKTPLDKLRLGIILLGMISREHARRRWRRRNKGWILRWNDRISLLCSTKAVTVFQWSRLSDRVGRKPILMLGMMGTIISLLTFGLSRTFWALVISRYLSGLLNGNIGVMKSTMGELTDNTNRADAFALMPALSAFGATMGPFLGGTLTRPADEFPRVFTGRFWKEYPYFLPCAAPAAIVFVILVITGVWFKETVIRKKHKMVASSVASTQALVKEYDETRIILSALFTFPVVISIANYMMLAFLHIATIAVLPLIFHMPIHLGGLDFDPVVIGYAMGAYGLGKGAFQIFFFAKIVRRFGTRRTFIMSMAALVPVFMMFPVVSILARANGVFWGVWVLVGMMLFLLFFMDTAFGCIFIYVTESAPSRHIGATNGLAQTTTSTARAVGPVLSTSLFSFSIRHNVMGGYGVYVVLTGLALLSLTLGVQLPEQTWAAKQVAESEPMIRESNPT